MAQQQQQQKSKSVTTITKKIMIGTVLTQLALFSTTTDNLVVNGQSAAAVAGGGIVSIPSSGTGIMKKQQNQQQKSQKLNSKSHLSNTVAESVVYYPKKNKNINDGTMNDNRYKNVIELITDAEKDSNNDNVANIFNVNSRNNNNKNNQQKMKNQEQVSSTSKTIDLLDSMITTEPKVMYGTSESVMTSESSAAALLWDQESIKNDQNSESENMNGGSSSYQQFEKLVVYPTIGFVSALGLVGLVNYTQKKYQEYKMMNNNNNKELLSNPLLASTTIEGDFLNSSSDPLADAFQNVEGGAMIGGQGDALMMGSSQGEQLRSSSSTGSSNIMSGVYALFGRGEPTSGTKAVKKSAGGTTFFSSSSSSKKGSNTPAPLPEDDNNQFFTDDLQDTLNEIFLLFMRLGVASMMIHHGQEKIMSAELFDKYVMAEYFTWLPGPAELYTYGAGYFQLIGPIFLALGVFSRFAAGGMAGTMLGAYYYHFNSTGFEGFPLSKIPTKVPVFHNYAFETPTLYFVIFLYFAVHGPGKYSVANALGWNKDKSLKGLFKQ